MQSNPNPFTSRARHAGPSQPRRHPTTAGRRYLPDSDSSSERSDNARRSRGGGAHMRNPAAEAFARLRADAEMDVEPTHPPQRPNAPIRVAKQARSAQRAAPPAAPAAHRPTMRKPATAPSDSNPTKAKSSQSSFPFMAPLLRARPSKSTAAPLPHLAAQEEREKRARREDGEYALGTRSAPRMSLASMSVQRRVGQSPRKRVVVHAPSPAVRRGANTFPEADVHVGRNGKLVVGSSDSESEREVLSLSSEDEGEDAMLGRREAGRMTAHAVRPTLNYGRKTARKRERAARKRDLGEPSPLKRKARKREGVEISEESDRASGDVLELTESPSDEGIGELLDAFSALSSAASRLKERRRLPFLLRNLRMGFEARCRTFRIPIGPEDFPKSPVNVVYRYAIDESEEEDSDELVFVQGKKYQEFLGALTEWVCPLCELHKPFRNRPMLAYHLINDHAEVNVSWVQRKVKDEVRWRIDILLPKPDKLEDGTPHESEDDESESEEEEDDIEIVPQDNQDDQLNVSRIKRRPEQPPTLRSDPLFLPGSDDEAPEPATSPPFLVQPESEDVKPKRSPAPGVKHRTSPTPARQGLTTAIRKSYRGSLPARYPSPPPPTDPQGPAAQYPYLPEKTPDGQELYSCRIGGPRIFDLLTILPMDDFGVMSWEIVQREEELFEMEDVCDEDKVMLALWNRWIMINRSEFIFHDYSDGVIKFIDKYWEIIHQAAGWRALRAFLIMLCMNRYLKFEQILKVLQHYESKTGMDLWYKDAEGGGGGS